MAVKALRKGEMTPQTRRNLRNGLLFASPWIIGFLAFLGYPLVASIFYSVTNYTLSPKPVRFVGVENYVRMFTDEQIRNALWNTIYLTIVGNPIWLVFGFVTALLLNLRVRGQMLYRTIYFLPIAVPLVPMSLAWVWMLNPKFGLVNALLGLVGITGPNWFADPQWSKPAVILMQCWPIAFVTIIYLAALQGIPHELYEAAELDGASGWRKVLHITLPMVSPATLFNLITGMIWSIQVFTPVLIIGTATAGYNNAATGAPQGSLLVYGLYLYRQAFGYLKMGYASALAWGLFILILLTTLLTFAISRRYTYYESSDVA
jgi:multiple sugar transport system permease protein